MLTAEVPGAFAGLRHVVSGAGSAELTEQNFSRIQYWLNRLSGRELKDYEKLTIQSRLSSCAVLAGCDNVNQYIDMLAEQSNDFSLSEWQCFVEHLLVSESWFRREARLFQFLKQLVFPEMSSDIRILSAGCGSGEEAYDIAFECAEFFGLFGAWKVVALDISHTAIVQADEGCFAAAHCRLLPQKFIRHYMTEQNQSVKVSGAIREKLSFQQHNLLQLKEDIPYQVVFCRNVLMDMDKKSAELLIHKLSAVLDKGGYLIVSHNESLQPYFPKAQCLTPYIVKML